MHLVNIEFQRVQTFLFAAPRLRDMVGANALLGQALRLTLAGLAVKAHVVSVPPVLPGPDANDPLNAAGGDYIDDPQALFGRGILARDGGHFRVLFNNDIDANEFCRAARKKLADELPGLRCSFEVFPLKTLAKTLEDANGKPPPAATERALLDLPQFQVCQSTGTGPAAAAVTKDEYDSKREDERNARKPSISIGVQKRREAYKEFRGQKSGDIVGLLDRHGKLPGKVPPNDFRDMCNGDYLAVIHADGNGIGKFSKLARGSDLMPSASETDILEREAKGERFYHAMRVAVRRATVDAIHKTFASISADGAGGCRPYQLLMLGGDDLLLVCRAKSAIEFVIEYARALKDQQTDAAASKPYPIAPPTIGAGIVIAPPTMPFHHLHHLAEELASSAKRLYRRLETENRPASVVDWLVATGSWSADPIAARRETALVRYDDAGKAKTLALARRPLPILGDATDGDLTSLESLWEKSKEIGAAVKDGKIARSQLRRLVDELPKGLRWSKAVFDEWKEGLSDNARNLLPPLWTPLGLGGDHFATSLADLVEVFEVNKLATAG